jgi:DNA polymerase III epsilon subunit-like protein
MMCAFDLETTGLDAELHDIAQICLLPLDSNVRPLKSIKPFYMTFRPENPELADPKALRVNKLKLNDLDKFGMDQTAAIDLLQNWFERLDLPYTPSGLRKRVIILGHNVHFDIQFMMKWLGESMYNDLFYFRPVDTLTVAAYLNDRAAMHANPIPYPKLTLGSLASRLEVTNEDAHDALQDCITVAEIYRRLICQGILG